MTLIVITQPGAGKTTISLKNDMFVDFCDNFVDSFVINKKRMGRKI